MATCKLEGSAKEFLARLFEKTQGEPSHQISMYDVGTSLGWDRDAASRTAQDLMGGGLVEIRTLSGGIGISAEGVAAMQAILGPSPGSGTTIRRIENARLLNEGARLAVAQVCDGIKTQLGNLGLDFDTLAEMMADLKTVSCQLDSTRPKAAIVRECLRSLEHVLKDLRDNKSLAEIRTLIGE
jgi:hypothetical protein